MAGADQANEPQKAQPALFELCGISKQFPGIKALDHVSFEIRAGEVHMLLGENGAGKSTLMKVLAGAYRADAGSFLHKGVAAEINSPAAAQRFGIAVIFQEFSLVPYLDIAQNIFLGREFPGRIPGTISRRHLYAGAQRLLKSLGFDIDPKLPVHALSVAQQQMVEIAKAVSQDARILVMDEPTAALSDREAKLLFALIARLKARGVAIVYISHRLAEVFALGDRITVLRDGRKIASMLPSETTPDELVKLMVGRAVERAYSREFAAPGEVVLEVRGLASAQGISGIDLTVREGEIVGLSGLVGSGRTEVARAIFGADSRVAGEIRLFGERVPGIPADSVRRGMAMAPENRKTQGLAMSRSVRENIVLAGLEKMFPTGTFSPERATRAARAVIERLRIATPSPLRPVETLSGGNQQKVVIGKWLNAGAKFFIFDEPTRGIDVGAKSEIFALLERLAVKERAGILMISSEQSEIVHLCDRAYVMRSGRIAGELGREELSEPNILRLAMHQ
jgi:ribose transport system ATP-binding protein